MKTRFLPKNKKVPRLKFQSKSALISSDSKKFQSWVSAVTYLKISEQPSFSSEQRWFSPKKRRFRAEQRWFSLKRLWNLKFSEQKNKRWIRVVPSLNFSQTADFFRNKTETPSFQSKKNQLWIRAASALIFFETELITAEALWNSSNQSWFSLRQR